MEKGGEIMNYPAYIAQLRKMADDCDTEKEVLMARGFCGKPEALIDLSMRIGRLIGEAKAYRTVAKSLERKA